MVGEPLLLRHPDRVTAHLDDERLGEGRAMSTVVTPKQQSWSRSRSTSVPVKVMAGWRASGTRSLPMADSKTEIP